MLERPWPHATPAGRAAVLRTGPRPDPLRCEHRLHRASRRGDRDSRGGRRAREIDTSGRGRPPGRGRGRGEGVDLDRTNSPADRRPEDPRRDTRGGAADRMAAGGGRPSRRESPAASGHLRGAHGGRNLRRDQRRANHAPRIRTGRSRGGRRAREIDTSGRGRPPGRGRGRGEGVDLDRTNSPADRRPEDPRRDTRGGAADRMAAGGGRPSRRGSPAAGGHLRGAHGGRNLRRDQRRANHAPRIRTDQRGCRARTRQTRRAGRSSPAEGRRAGHGRGNRWPRDLATGDRRRSTDQDRGRRAPLRMGRRDRRQPRGTPPPAGSPPARNRRRDDPPKGERRLRTTARGSDGAGRDRRPADQAERCRAGRRGRNRRIGDRESRERGAVPAGGRPPGAQADRSRPPGCRGSGRPS